MKLHMYNALAQCPVRGRHPTTISVIPFLAGHSRVLYSRTWLLVARGEPGTFFSGGGADNKGLGEALRA